ncbi:MAG: Holliday junction resolvase RuvX [Burkholderiaceae bacterium]
MDTRGRSERPVPETILSFDFGARRIGVALGNSLTGDARALETIDDERTERRFERVGRLIAQWQPDRLVVGRPCLDDGGANESTRRCERFARQLAGRFGLPVATVDERYSTLEAQATLGRRHDDDAEAAATILRQYFHEHAHT